jgi:ribosomal protein S18 acetylase RimI-like enzyme
MKGDGMKAQGRAYRNQDDLLAIGALIRQAYRLDPCWNSWSLALYDIWSQRKIGDQQVFGISDWQHDIRLWEDSQTGLLGAAAFRDPDLVKLTTFPGHKNLLIPMLDWVEARFHQKAIPDKKMKIETSQGNPTLEKLLVSQGYQKDSGHYIQRQKDLTDGQNELVILPRGFKIQHIQSADDLRKFHRGTELVFNFPDNPEVYQILRQAPSFVPELDLIVLSPEGEIASFGSVWFDRSLSLAEFEPVGTAPEFRRLGLGSALIAEACNRLRKLSCKKITVMSWSESAGANRLYEKAGLHPKGEINYWIWDQRTHPGSPTESL